MRKTWFHQNNLTSAEATELTRQYQRRNIKTQKHLSNDRLSWCVSAYLEESNYAPRTSSQWQSALGRMI